MRFNPTKLTVERNGNTSWKVLYDNKTLILNFKSFSGVICRSKSLPRQKYVRIDDLCLKKIYREICHLICHLINAKEYRDWCNEYCKVFLNYFDHRLSIDKIHYFEDISIVFEEVILMNKGEGTKQLQQEYKEFSEKIMPSVLKCNYCNVSHCIIHGKFDISCIHCRKIKCEKCFKFNISMNVLLKSATEQTIIYLITYLIF